MMKFMRWSAGVLISTLLVGRLPAQMPGDWSEGPQNRGFTGMIGVGTANGTTEVDGDFGAAGAPASARYTSSAMTYDLSLGYALSGRWRIGVEVQYMPSGYSTTYYPSVGSAGMTSYFTLAAGFYPKASLGLFVKANAGYGLVNYHAPVLVNGVATGGNTVPLSGGGFAAGLGAGYEWRPSGGAFMFVPFVNYVSQLSKVTLSGGTQPWSCRASLLQVGVSFGYNR